MKRIQIYTTSWCGACAGAKAFLAARAIPYEETTLDGDPHFRQKLLDRTGNWTVPQILIDGRPIGGYSELRSLDRQGRLDEIMGGLVAV